MRPVQPMPETTEHWRGSRPARLRPWTKQLKNHAQAAARAPDVGNAARLEVDVHGVEAVIRGHLGLQIRRIEVRQLSHAPNHWALLALNSSMTATISSGVCMDPAHQAHADRLGPAAGATFDFHGHLAVVDLRHDKGLGSFGQLADPILGKRPDRDQPQEPHDQPLLPGPFHRFARRPGGAAVRQDHRVQATLQPVFLGHDDVRGVFPDFVHQATDQTFLGAVLHDRVAPHVMGQGR